MQEPTLIPKSEPQKFTEKQMRELRRTYVTVRHGTVRECGHKIDLNKQPKNNCPDCWEAYFKTVDGLLERLHETLVTQGLRTLKAQYGDKLVKQFARFLDNELHIDRLRILDVIDDRPTDAEDWLMPDERKDAIRTQEGEGSQGEAGSSDTGVGSGEIQGPLHAFSGTGQKAPNNEQPDAAREATELSDQDNQHGATEPRL